MDGRSEELVQRVLLATAKESPEAIERLILEANSEAQSEVKNLLKSAIKASLLQSALEQLDIRHTRSSGHALAEQKNACYLYCITACDQRVPQASDTVDGPVITVGLGALQAIVSKVSQEEFGQAALERNVKDARWVQRMVRAHDAVVKAAFAEGPIIPLRFCTVLRDEDAVRQVLEVHAELIHRTLNSIAHTKEWGLKVWWKEDGQERQPESGREYLLRSSERINGQRRDSARHRASAIHENVAMHAREATLLPMRDSAHGAELLLNAAYLVAEQDEPDFHNTLRTLCDQNRNNGLECEVSGPWPPYNFVKLDLSLEPAKQN